MSEENIERFTIEELKEKKGYTDWELVDNQTEEELGKEIAEDPDAELSGTDWLETAELIVPGEKKRVTMNMDQEVAGYFKRKGYGYQTRINAVLKAYVLHQKQKKGP